MERRIIWMGRRALPMDSYIHAAVLKDDDGRLSKVVSRSKLGFVSSVLGAKKGGDLGVVETSDDEFQKIKELFSKKEIDILGETTHF